jgi:hypothetical protein
MDKFSYTLILTATDKAEAESKMKAISILAAKLKANELSKMADIVKNDPIKTALAKKALGL